MRILLPVFFLCFVLTAAAQDDYPDYRSKKDNFIKISQKDIRNDLASFAIAGIDESTGKGKLKSIPATHTDASSMKFEGNNIQVIIKAGGFDKSKHKLQYYDEKYLVKIDGKPYYGSYGEVPRSTIAEVTVIRDKDTIRIPSTALFDLYNPTFSYRDGSGTVKTFNGVYLSNDNKTIYVYMLNKETRGSYEVTWVIQDKQYVRRVVDFGLLR
jgi:hypothetical protein